MTELNKPKKIEIKVGDIVKQKRGRGWSTEEYLIVEKDKFSKFYIRPLHNASYGTYHAKELQKQKHIKGE